ncbi:MAG: cell wall metabolism sensor histidine kinase WalK [Thermoproteota archaeon]|nr:cell wall metabolism sensor histidine kinase WalK [Thermoproteota archaeon]
MGLFISKNIVEAHGGRIWAENNSNEKGATFTFSLPLSKEKQPPTPVL